MTTGAASAWRRGGCAEQPASKTPERFLNGRVAEGPVRSVGGRKTMKLNRVLQFVVGLGLLLVSAQAFVYWGN